MRKILLVDDEQVIRTLLRQYCRRISSKILVQEAVDGQAAKNVIRDYPPFDLVITDINMPNLDGQEMAEWMIQTGYCPSLIFISGNPKELEKTRNLDYPGAARLEKPIIFSDFQKLAKFMLGMD